MKYVPREIDEAENVNVTPRKPLKDLVLMLGGVVLIVIVIYFATGLLVDVLAPHISRDLEVKMGRLFASSFCSDEHWSGLSDLQVDQEGSASGEGPPNAQVEEILKKYVALLSTKDRGLDYKTCIVDTPEANALALPGGQIVVFRGLIDEIEDQSQLEFVIAHELGHFHARDHLKRLGRSLITLAASILIVGNDSVATDFIFDSIGGIEMKFSQAQELAADAFALDLVSRSGGGCAGAVDFMQAVADKGKHGKLAYYFASHPHPIHRKKALLALSGKNKFCSQQH